MALPHAEHDYIQQRLARTQEPYELEMLEAMRDRLAPGDLVLDVGANIGNHSLYLAVVAGCRVVAFEPNAELVDGLRESITANGLEATIEVRQVGVGSVAAFGVLDDLNPANLGAQSVAVTHEGGDFAVVTLDDEHFGGSVAALKIDVEGAELDVLRGAEALVARDRPLLFVECGDRAGFAAVTEHLRERGYAPLSVYNATATYAFEPVGKDLADSAVAHALAAVLEERYELRAEVARLRRDLRDARLAQGSVAPDPAARRGEI